MPQYSWIKLGNQTRVQKGDSCQGHQFIAWLSTAWCIKVLMKAIWSGIMFQGSTKLVTVIRYPDTGSGVKGNWSLSKEGMIERDSHTVFNTFLHQRNVLLFLFPRSCCHALYFHLSIEQTKLKNLQLCCWVRNSNCPCQKKLGLH